MVRLTSNLISELTSTMTVGRLTRTGLFSRLDILDEEGYNDILLHRSVLDRALIDLFSPHEALRKDVQDWLRMDNDSFIFACERACLEPDKVYSTFKAIEVILKDGGTTEYNKPRTTKQTNSSEQVNT